MASLFKDPNKLSAYRDRRFPGTQEEYEEALLNSTTVYVGNMSFYTTEEQVYELFSRAGEIKKMIMGLDKNSKTPCGFCFVMYYSRDDAEDCVKYISGTILDDRPIRVDFDWGFQDGRQWGRGRSGGQVRDEYRTDYDPGRGGYGKIVQKELEAQRQLVDYGAGSLGSFQPVMPPNCMVETMVKGVPTVMAEITIVNDTETTTVGGQIFKGESQTLYIGEIQIMNPDLKKTRDFGRVVIRTRTRTMIVSGSRRDRRQPVGDLDLEVCTTLCFAPEKVVKIFVFACKKLHVQIFKWLKLKLL